MYRGYESHTRAPCLQNIGICMTMRLIPFSPVADCYWAINLICWTFTHTLIKKGLSVSVVNLHVYCHFIFDSVSGHISLSH